MVSGGPHTVTARLDIFRDILTELATAVPTDRAAGVAAAIGNRLMKRLGDTEIDELPSVEIVSDLAPPLRCQSRTCTTRVIDSNRPDYVSRRPGRRLVGAWSVVVVKAASYSR